MNLRGTPSLECTGSERYDMYIDRASAYAKAHERALAASMRESAEGALAAIATSKVPPPPPPSPPLLSAGGRLGPGILVSRTHGMSSAPPRSHLVDTRTPMGTFLLPTRQTPLQLGLVPVCLQALDLCWERA